MPRSIDSLRPKKDGGKLQRGSVPTTVVQPTVATNAGSGEIEGPANIMKHKAPRFTLKTKILGIFVIVLVAAVAFVGYNYFVNRDAVARIKGKTISKQQFEDAKNAYGKLATNRDGSTSGTDVEKYAREQLLIEQAMLADMERNKLSLKDSDIVKELQKNPDSLKGSNDAETIRLNIEAIKAIYGFTDDATAIRAIRMRAMQDVLATKVLSYRDVLHVITRWDISAVNGVTWSEAEADRLAKGALEQRILPLMQRNASDEEIINVATSGRDLEDSSALSPSAAIPIKMLNLNRAANPGQFQDQSEWNEIERLTKVGEFTPITKSAAGYYYIDRLTAIGEGSFASWDDYNAQVLKDASLFNDGWDVRKLTSAFSQKQIADNDAFFCSIASNSSIFSKIARSILGVQNASACSVTATDRHTVTFSGRVMRSSGDPWSGATVLVTPRAGQARCGNASADGAFPTDGAGYWSSGSWSANALSDRNASLTGQAFSCYIKWRAIVTVPGGCQKDVDLIMPSGANGSNQGNKDIYIDCAPILKGTIKITHILHNRDGSVVEGRVPTDKRLVDCVSSTSIAGPGNPFGFTFICLDNDTQSSAEWRDEINSGGYYLALISNVGGTVSPMDLNDNWSYLKMEATYSNQPPGAVFDITAEPHSFYVGSGVTTSITVHFKDNRPEEPPRVNFTGRKINEAGAVGSPYGGANVCIDSTACDTSNPYAINGILANQAHSLTSANVTGFDLVGYKESGGPLIPSSTYQYYAGQAGNGETITVDWVYKPKISGTITSTCSLITTSVSGPSGTTVDLTIDGVSLGSSSSITVPNEYKDGVTRTLRLTATYGGTTYNLDTKTHVCANSAQCISNNFNAVLGGGADMAGTINVQVVMGNNGGSIWKKKPSVDEGHRLVLTEDSDEFWTSPTTQLVSGGALSDSDTVNPGANHTFNVSLKPQAANITGRNIPLKVQMAYVGPSGIEEFGQICQTTVTVRGFYHPWLRIQNGSTTSLDMISSQGIVGQPSGVRGVRKATDPSFDTTYMVMAVMGGSNFCSSNAYLFGQANANSACASTFSPYEVTLQKDQMSSYYDRVKSIADSSTCTSYDPAKPPLDPTKRAEKKIGSINSVLNAAGQYIGGSFIGSNCPAFHIVNGGDTLNGPSPKKYNGGKGTVLLDDSLTIKADIVAMSPATVSYNSAGDLTDLAAALPSLGILVKGDVYIDPAVTRIDAYIFATGKIYTCSAYPTNTTGYKNPASPAEVAQAQQCNKRLVVRGGLYGLNGVAFGRNYFQNNTGLPISNPDFDYQPEDRYWGEPAEDIIGNGMSLITTPPGFDLLPNGNSDSLVYLQGNYTPKL